ncbi:hypothetical protein FQN60_011817 [Etheostoma spectabile]|uniref:Uncharacterized protein n=1 Tax=Etheostoma spectabile TaxID=54343 RepID=A0A5J5DN71_9PERO|nr:hypothetical protein FQN60_011817 [Etheostoma spectabile]
MLSSGTFTGVLQPASPDLAAAIQSSNRLIHRLHGCLSLNLLMKLKYGC